ncbi:MAG TPA: hypothetical protein VGR20_05535, partial [Acidimicrobiia bacterium]|nr:hypothetical protein [Acidimicrobiia bacterium]
MHLPAWARAHGHTVTTTTTTGTGTGTGTGPGDELTLVRGGADDARWRGATRAGGASPGSIVERAPSTWGLA